MYDTDVKMRNKWISVEDQLPPLFENVIVFGIIKKLNVGPQAWEARRWTSCVIGFDEEEGLWGWLSPCDYRVEKVTQWIPLPNEELDNTYIRRQRGMKMYDTDVKTKAKNWPAFAKLIENQLTHGGDKYEVSSGKEMTDLICEKYPGKTGVDWILGTIDKYTGRYKNFEREKDLLKIVAFAYIAWLRKGYHLRKDHDEDVRKKIER